MKGRLRNGRSTSSRFKRNQKSKAKTSHHIHGMYEVAKPKDWKTKQEKLIATLSKFRKGPKGALLS